MDNANVHGGKVHATVWSAIEAVARQKTHERKFESGTIKVERFC